MSPSRRGPVHAKQKVKEFESTHVVWGIRILSTVDQQYRTYRYRPHPLPVVCRVGLAAFVCSSKVPMQNFQCIVRYKSTSGPTDGSPPLGGRGCCCGMWPCSLPATSASAAWASTSRCSTSSRRTSGGMKCPKKAIFRRSLAACSCASSKVVDHDKEALLPCHTWTPLAPPKARR